MKPIYTLLAGIGIVFLVLLNLLYTLMVFGIVEFTTAEGILAYSRIGNVLCLIGNTLLLPFFIYLFIKQKRQTMNDVNSTFGVETQTWICPRCKAENSKTTNICTRCNTAQLTAGAPTGTASTNPLQNSRMTTTSTNSQSTSDSAEKTLSTMAIVLLVIFGLLSLVLLIVGIFMFTQKGMGSYGAAMIGYCILMAIMAVSGWSIYKVTANISLTLKEMNAKMR